MKSPDASSCAQCSRPLAVDSVSGLCEICLATAATIDTPRLLSSGAAATADTLAHSPSFSVDSPLVERSTFCADGATRTPRPQFDDETAEGPQNLQRDLRPGSPPGYDLLELLGGGGMGRVYLAREHIAERTVAIKFLNSPSVASAFNRFLIEVRSQVKLRHPHIIEVIAAEAHGREPFFTMEAASDGSLADWTKPGRLLPPAEATRLIEQAAEGIAFAHSKKVLHRDIKPSNILLAKDADGRLLAKVSDFGLAKRTDLEDGLTHSGALGTASYMSPEAAAGRNREIGEASDVYGLGATLYHLLTGRPPFQDDDTIVAMTKVVKDPVVRPRSLNAAVPPGLEAIVMKALEKSPASRYATASDFADDLKLHLEGKPQRAPELTPRRRMQKWLGRQRLRLAASAAVVLAAIGLVAATNYLRPDPVVPVETDPVEEYLASVRSKLQAGETVELIGEKGLPKYHKFWLEKDVLQEEANGTCSYRAFVTSLLELSPPDMGIEHYEVSLELQHLRASIPGAPKTVDTDSIAFYFSHGRGSVGKKTIHNAFSLLYKDFDMADPKAPPRTRGATLMSTGFIEAPEGPDPVFATPPIRWAAKPFTPTAGAERAVPGEWRRIIAEIGPGGIHVQWRADRAKPDDRDAFVTLARWSRDEVQSRYSEAADGMEKIAPGAKQALPPWSPGLGFGVRATKSAVAIRNVRITPLPRRL